MSLRINYLFNYKEQKSLNEKVGQYLKETRMNKDLSGKDLGVLLNISQQQISRYERGQNQITLDKLELMLSALEITWSDFIDSIIRADA